MTQRSPVSPFRTFGLGPVLLLLVLWLLSGPGCSGGSGDGPSAPSLNASPEIERVSPAEATVTAEVGQPLSFEVQATDPEGRPLTFEFLLDGARVASTNRFSFTPDATGPHEVVVRVSDGVRVVTHRWSISITPDVANPPVAAVVVSPDSGATPLAVTIEASASDVDGSVVRYEVDTDGDGTYEVVSAAPLTLSRVFNTAGAFRVRVKVTDDEGLTGLAERLVRVTTNLPPRATLTLSAEEGLAPLSVRIRGEGTDPDGTVALYELDTDGDGTYEISSASPIDTTLVFTDFTRSYPLELRVTDAAGATDFARKTVRPLPEVDAALSGLSQAETDRLLSDGKAAREITVRIVDPRGNPIAGVEVELSSSRNGGALGMVDLIVPERGVTDAGGVLRAEFTTQSSSTLLGDALITASAAGKLLNDVITIQMVTPVSAVLSTLTCPFGPTHVAGSPSEPNEARITAVVRDVQGRPLAGTFVQFMTRDQAVWPVTPPNGRSDAAGVFQAVVTSSRAASTFLDFYADGHKASATCILGFIP